MSRHLMNTYVPLPVAFERGEGAWLGNLGSAYYVLGEARKAIEYYERALAIAHSMASWGSASLKRTPNSAPRALPTSTTPSPTRSSATATTSS